MTKEQIQLKIIKVKIIITQTTKTTGTTVPEFNDSLLMSTGKIELKVIKYTGRLSLQMHK